MLSISSTKVRLTLTLEGGEGRLFKFNTGHGFLGTSAGLSGDYNRDGTVNVADYVVWRDGLGTTHTSGAYDVWRTHFGHHAVSGGTADSTSPVAVPEPAICAFVLVGMLGITIRRADVL